MPQLGGLDSCVAPSIILAQRVKEPLHLPFDFRCIGVHAALLPVWLRAEGLITYFGKTGKLFPAHSYAVTWKSFSKWAWKDRRTRTDLLADLEPPKVVATSKRTALTSDQAIRLVATTRISKPRHRMTGED